MEAYKGFDDNGQPLGPQPLQGDGTFDASGFTPPPPMVSHPVGRFQFEITACEIKPNGENAKDPRGAHLAIEFTTPVGKISDRHNLWNNNPQTVEISNRKMISLCHAVGRFKLNMNNHARELIGARGFIEVAPQKANADGSPSKYTEIARIMDVNGNEPGAGGTQQATPPAASQWSNPAAAPPNPAPPQPATYVPPSAAAPPPNPAPPNTWAPNSGGEMQKSPSWHPKA